MHNMVTVKQIHSEQLCCSVLMIKKYIKKKTQSGSNIKHQMFLEPYKRCVRVLKCLFALQLPSIQCRAF